MSGAGPGESGRIISSYLERFNSYKNEQAKNKEINKASRALDSELTEIESYLKDATQNIEFSNSLADPTKFVGLAKAQEYYAKLSLKIKTWLKLNPDFKNSQNKDLYDRAEKISNILLSLELCKNNPTQSSEELENLKELLENFKKNHNLRSQKF